MPLSTLINRPCTIIRRSESGTKDRYGDDVTSEQLIATVCEVQQFRRDELTDAQVSDDLWRGFFLPGTVADTGDGLEVDGLGSFEFVGSPWATRNPRTQVAEQVEVTLRLVAGSVGS